MILLICEPLKKGPCTTCSNITFCMRDSVVTPILICKPLANAASNGFMSVWFVCKQRIHVCMICVLMNIDESIISEYCWNATTSSDETSIQEQKYLKHQGCEPQVTKTSIQVQKNWLSKIWSSAHIQKLMSNTFNKLCKRCTGKDNLKLIEMVQQMVQQFEH